MLAVDAAGVLEVEFAFVTVVVLVGTDPAVNLLAIAMALPLD